MTMNGYDNEIEKFLKEMKTTYGIGGIMLNSHDDGHMSMDYIWNKDGELKYEFGINVAPAGEHTKYVAMIAIRKYFREHFKKTA